jgi:protease I
MSLAGKHIAVLVENNYQEMELWYPVYRFREAGAEVVVAGKEAGKTYTSKLGYPVTADCTISSLKAAALDALIVPGGYAPDLLRSYPEVLKLAREMEIGGKVVAAICHAGWVLCSAGILEGRRATSYFTIKDDMLNAGALWEDAEVVVDRRMVTSRRPADLPAFCREIARLLGGE